MFAEKRQIMKPTTIISIICISAIIFGSCRARTSTENQAETSDFAEIIEQTDAITKEDGVVINGVRWATRNVDAPGTFAQNPEDAGMFFQWNRRKGWNATDEEVEGWDSSISEGTKWYAENDPCPDGWRVPTYDELRSLVSLAYTSIFLTTKNGIDGLLFGNAPNQIFLPAVGFRSPFHNGALRSTGRSARFWSNTAVYEFEFDAWNLPFNIDAVGVGLNFSRFSWGFSIRCVAIE